jgi:flagellar hook assembly protein FlgD
VFALARDVGVGPVEIDVFDVNGRLVRTLVRSTLGPGERCVAWDGRDRRGLAVSSGMYILRLSTSGRIWTSRLMVVR